MARRRKGRADDVFFRSINRNAAQAAIWPAALMRRTSVFACGENLGGGAIHLPRALKYRRVERPTGVEPKKKDSRPFRRLFFSALQQDRCQPPVLYPKPNRSPAAAGSIWEGGARKRADGVFLGPGHKKTSEQSKLCSDVVEISGIEPLTS